MDQLAEMLRRNHRFDTLRMAAAIVAAVGIYLIDLRQQQEWGAILRLGVAALPCIALYVLALAPAVPGEKVDRWQTVLLLCGISLLLLTLLELADLFGADDSESSSGTLFWVFGLIGLFTAYLAYIVRSPIHVLLAALALAVSFLAFVDWAINDLALKDARNLLLCIAIAYGAIGLWMRARLGEEALAYADYVVVAGGLAGVLAGTIGVGSGVLGGAFENLFFLDGSNFWEFILLAVSLLLVGYTVWTTYRATAYVGVIGLVAFVSVVASGGGVWAWPLILALLGISGVVVSVFAGSTDQSVSK